MHTCEFLADTDKNLALNSTSKEQNSLSDGSRKRQNSTKLIEEDKVPGKAVEANSTFESSASSKESKESGKKRRKTVVECSTNQCTSVESIDAASIISKRLFIF